MSLDPETLAQFLETLDRFVRERLIPNEERVADGDAIPPELVQEIREMGLFGMSIPEEHGGIGLTMAEEVQAALVLGQASPVFRSLVGTNNGIGSQGIIIDGTPEQKAHYLPQLASGEMIASFALTEPDAGSDAGSLRCSARLDGDHYVLNGTKRFITNAPHAGLFTVFARTDPDSKSPPASPPSWSRPAPPACIWGPGTARWARRDRIPAMSSWKIAASRQVRSSAAPTGWARASRPR